MSAGVYWLFAFVLAYWAYCITWGVKGAIRAKTASDYFIAGRQINVWVFVLAATATSFSGWTFVGHPALVWRDGFPYAYASFYAITIPFTGVIFLKRQWLLGKKYGFVTPGEMFSTYFKSDTMRILTVIVALFFSIPYLGVQLRASGYLFNILTDGLFSVDVGMVLLAVVVTIYVALGGLRSVAYVDTAQCILLAFGIVALGIITLSFCGGWEGLTQGIAKITMADSKLTPEGYSHYIAIPGVIQWVPSAGKAVGGVWTGVMILTYMFALMGIQSAPAFSMWAFSNKDPRPFPLQQVFASSMGIGFILMVFTAIQGMGGHALMDANIIPSLAGGKQGNLVPWLIHLLGDHWPVLVGLLAVCALAAMQSTGAAYMSTAAGMLTRDIYKHFMNKEATHKQQKFFGRILVLLVVFAALVVAVTSTDALVLLGGLAVSYGFQMWPALIAICYVPWFTKQGIVSGLIAGLVGVTLTYKFKFGLPWGAYPLTIHSAGWGILFNLTFAILVSAVTQPDRKEFARRFEFHKFLRQHAGLPSAKKHLKPIGWIITVLWFIFAIGPGAVIGNTIFGDPKAPSTWFLGMPSIWIWQLLWWALGCYMMYFLAFKLEMSTNITGEVEVLAEDIGDVRVSDGKPIPEVAG
ncbi:MAG: sodium:solute symporter family protein [Deltaproteobacteria bacterium]|nr:sodium:solute symporter family protein [Deltaproteobacteria bacterium]